MSLQDRLEKEFGVLPKAEAIEAIRKSYEKVPKKDQVRTPVEWAKDKGPEYFIEALADDSFKKEIKEYIDGYVDFKIQEAFEKLFKAKDDEKKHRKRGDKCLCDGCGEMFYLRHGKQRYCDNCTHNNRSIASQNWKWLMKRFPTLGYAILREKRKEENNGNEKDSHIKTNS